MASQLFKAAVAYMQSRITSNTHAETAASTSNNTKTGSAKKVIRSKKSRHCHVKISPSHILYKNNAIINTKTGEIFAPLDKTKLKDFKP
jgi:hypothetical protein